MTVHSLRGIGRLLQEITTCPVCGKSKIVRATSHQGHGTGQSGESHYTATAFEAITIETHCTCPGGPCDVAGLLKRVEVQS